MVFIICCMWHRDTNSLEGKFLRGVRQKPALRCAPIQFNRERSCCCSRRPGGQLPCASAGKTLRAPQRRMKNGGGWGEGACSKGSGSQGCAALAVTPQGVDQGKVALDLLHILRQASSSMATRLSHGCRSCSPAAHQAGECSQQEKSQRAKAKAYTRANLHLLCRSLRCNLRSSLRCQSKGCSASD